jgi:hypothetical protein
MQPEYKTYIDTISIKINTLTTTANNNYLKLLLNFYNYNGLVFYKNEKYNDFEQTYTLYNNKQGILKLRQGTNGSKDFNPTYYIALEFYGLKSYDDKNDKESLTILKTTTSYLKENNIAYSVNTIDVAVDFININIYNILTLKTKARQKLNPLEQKFNTTIYFYKNCYVYNKNDKELEVRDNIIVEDITRLEIKLDKIKFKDNGTNHNSLLLTYIEIELNKYNIMYFRNEDDCYDSKMMYFNTGMKMSYKLKQFNTKAYKIKIDFIRIKHFIDTFLL